MIYKTEFGVPLTLIKQASMMIPSDDFKFCLNEPTGNFFYDPWKLKTELKGTVWEEIYNSLPTQKGEAILIRLTGGESYISHADIDDRWHLNIAGTKCFLTDLDELKMYPLVQDGIWYNMDAGKRHTASNFGNRIRYQLVVRHLLKKNNIVDPIKMTIKSKDGVDPNDARFLFDDIISPWLNYANKSGTITDFSYINGVVVVSITPTIFKLFEMMLPEEFEIL